MVGRIWKIAGIAVLIGAMSLQLGCSAQKLKSGTNGSLQGQGDTAPNGVQRVELLVSAAASLKEAMMDVKMSYETLHPEVTVVLNYGASGSLQQQIQQGAPVDVFISAGTKQMNALSEDGLLIEETHKSFLKNELVLIAPASDSTLTSFEDLKGDGLIKLAVGEPASVPAGEYGVEALQHMGLMDKVSSRIVYGKDVKEVLAWVATANVTAGLVYATDAAVSDQVRVVDRAPGDSHQPILYPAAVIKDCSDEEEARRFIAYVYSKEAGILFEKYGFESLQ